MTSEEKQEIGLWERLIGIITSPGTTLEAVVVKPTIWGPAAIIVLADLMLFFVTVPKLREFTLWNLGKVAQQLPPDQVAQMKTFAANGALVGGGVATVIGPFVAWLIAALLFKFFNLFIGKEAPFNKLYAVAVITTVPIVLGNVLRTIMVATSPAESFPTITTSAALALPKGTIGPVFAILSQIDPFYIWSLILLAMGTALVLRTSVRKTGSFVFILWVIMAAFGALVASFKTVQFPGA